MNCSASLLPSGTAGAELAEQFRVIAEIGGDIAFSIDCASCALLYVSPSIEQLLGYSPADIAAQLGDAGSALAALCAGMPERVRRLRNGDRSRLRLVRETELRGAHGYLVPVEVLSALVCDAGGEPVTLVGQVRDLSPRRQREAERKRFASMLNHEFRTPLSTIDGAVQRLEATCQDADDATRQRYRKIALATDRLIAMLDDYLSPDRMAEIGGERKPTSVAPRELLDEAAGLVRAAGRVVSVEVGELPDMLRCEPDGMRLALKILVDNAVAFSPETTPILLRGRLAASGIELAVRDHGAGVPLDEQARIFEKFFRGRNADGLPGSGLGLYMARSIVEVHGGVLSLVSPAAGGAEFRIWLPVAGAGKAPLRPQASSDHAAPAADAPAATGRHQ
ncbi:PAS domain-containing sensor histidine kinase [Massilia sp. YIM B02769]|uniref:PAS domain-containing sensor histidine kinase n=1 Tax=unclassified Massilia TaxID=2609279 RepID=UPI0025B633B9|nr:MULTISPECIES: PAS domain-containing sensor histidine kinase [unclassified Massilia]MDN4056744.1 PAS domain-containing sensor histidine kinase [Massilia sp. YIM B02769]